MNVLSSYATFLTFCIIFTQGKKPKCELVKMAEIIASMPFSKPISLGLEYKSPATMRLGLSGKSSFATSTNVVNSLMHGPTKQQLQERLLLLLHRHLLRVAVIEEQQEEVLPRKPLEHESPVVKPE